MIFPLVILLYKKLPFVMFNKLIFIQHAESNETFMFFSGIKINFYVELKTLSLGFLLEPRPNKKKVKGNG